MADSPALIALPRFELPTAFLCAVELAEAVALVTPTEWAEFSVDTDGPEAPQFPRWEERHQLLDQIEEETARLKRCLGATGPLGAAVTDTDDGPVWELYKRRFSDAAHSRSVRRALTKLAAAAIDVSGFAACREWQWDMRERGLRLLAWGVAQLWDGMSESERVAVRGELRRAHAALSWPDANGIDPPPYDGPQDIPPEDQYRVCFRYVARPVSHLEDVQQGMAAQVQMGQAAYLWQATPSQVVETATRALNAMRAIRAGGVVTPLQGVELRNDAFWALSCLRRVGETAPGVPWPTDAQEHRGALARAAGTLLTWIGGTPAAQAAIDPDEAEQAFAEFTHATDQLRAVTTPDDRTTHPSAPTPSCQASEGEPSEADRAILRLLNLFTNGLAEERIADAALILTNTTLNTQEKLTQLDRLMPIPPTASSAQLGRLLGVTKQAVMGTHTESG